MKQPMKLAFSGVMAALATVLLFLTGVAPMATLALPAIAGCLVIPVVVEAGLAWGFGMYGVCSVLSFLLASDREAFLFYLLFFGHYPALFAVLGRIGNKVARYVAKFLVFNAAMALEVLLSVYVLGIPFESFGILGPIGPVADRPVLTQASSPVEQGAEREMTDRQAACLPFLCLTVLKFLE